MRGHHLGSQMTNSAFQLVDDLRRGAVNDFEILVNGQNTVVATNPGPVLLPPACDEPLLGRNQLDLRPPLALPVHHADHGGQPIHAYIQLASDPPNTWRPWS